MFDGLFSGLGTGLIGGLMSYFGARSNARDQMDFQRNMSNTSYQRAAKDLEAAGLNRVLALGNPASTPAGAMAPVPDFASGMIQSSNAKTARDLADQNIKLATAQTAREASQTLLNTKNAEYIDIQKAVASADLAIKNRDVNLPVLDKMNAEISNLRQQLDNLQTQGQGFQIDNQVKMVEKRLRELEESKQQVLKAGYNAVAPVVDNASSFFRNLFSGSSDVNMSKPQFDSKVTESAVNSAKAVKNAKDVNQLARDLLPDVKSGKIDLDSLDWKTRLAIKALLTKE